MTTATKEIIEQQQYLTFLLASVSRDAKILDAVLKASR